MWKWNRNKDHKKQSVTRSRIAERHIRLLHDATNSHSNSKKETHINWLKNNEFFSNFKMEKKDENSFWFRYVCIFHGINHYFPADFDA